MDGKTEEDLKRTILYYPTIDVPPGAWLRQSILYWDEIASIVPQRWDGTEYTSFTPEVEYLYGEGEFRPVRPKKLIHHSYSKVRDFASEFKTIVNTKKFKSHLPVGGDRRLEFNIHQDKISIELLQFLQSRELAEDHEGEWIKFEKNTAFLYMSLLAQYLAEVDRNMTLPGTDRREYQELIYDKSEFNEGFACLDARFTNTLPIPRDDISLSDIVTFKRNYRQELLRFRNVIDDFKERLSSSEEKKEIKEELINFKEKIELELEDLNSALSDFGISTISGSLRTLVNVKSPTLWSTIGVATGEAPKIAQLPIEWTAAGLGLLGFIEIGCHLVDKRNERRAKLRDSSFAYLHHADQERILQ